MNNTYRKVSRGQVWFIPNNQYVQTTVQTSIQNKSRPWLFVSNNQCNQSSPVYTAVPLTTAEKVDLPTHVELLIGDKRNTILCEQVTTIPKQAIELNGSYYMFTLSEDIMRLVDEALSVQLGLQIVFPNSDRYWESLSRLIRARVKECIAHSNIQSIDVGKVATLLDIKVEEIVKSETNCNTVAEDNKEKEEKVEEPVEKTTGWAPHKPSKNYNKWTKESMEKFLSDCDKYTTSDMCQRYNMSMKTVYVNKSKFKKLLNGQS